MNWLQSDFEVEWNVIGLGSSGKNMVNHVLLHEPFCLKAVCIIFTHTSLAQANYYCLTWKQGEGEYSHIFDLGAWEQEYFWIAYDDHMKLFDILIFNFSCSLHRSFRKCGFADYIMLEKYAPILSDIFAHWQNDLDYIFGSVNKIYFGYAEILNIENNWLMVIMIIITMIKMGKIIIRKILPKKCNYSIENGRASFKGQLHLFYGTRRYLFEIAAWSILDHNAFISHLWNIPVLGGLTYI